MKKRFRGATHNLSHSVKQSGNMGYIMPIACFDVVPNDKIHHKVTALIRTQPLLAPLMHEVDIDIHAYFSADRLVWEDSENFQSGGDDGMDTSEPPYMVSPAGTGYAVGSLPDYLGLPTGVPGMKHSALPLRHYINIRNKYYRDSQLQPEIPFPMTGGLDTTTTYNLLAPCWKRDYFTKARPAPQLGPDVAIPLTGDAPIVSNGLNPQIRAATTSPTTDHNLQLQGTTNHLFGATPSVTGDQGMKWGTETGLEADLTDVSAVDIRDLREAASVQRYLEFNNIFGGRYWEQIMARFGARAQDYRLQWPEFLGAGSAKFQFSEVLQTAEGDDPVGEMRGHGISITGSNKYRYRVPEHGWVFVFMIVRPKTQYFQGLHRSWSRETKYDYMLPEFQNIGDQAIFNKEIYAASGTPDGVFGYTPMYEEYRTIPSRVAGEFKTTLNYWHMARDFASAPGLNSTFVTCNPTNRIYPSTSAAQLYFNIKHDIAMHRLIKQQPAYKLM